MEIFAPQMKVVAVILFCFLLLMQTFSKWLIVLEYELNKEYIAKNLCENRSRPILKCKGKCQLMKKMAAEEASGKTSSGSQIAKASFSEVLLDDKSPELQQPETLLQTAYYNHYRVGNYTTPLSSIFHPPLV